MIYGVSQRYNGVGYEVRVKWCKVVVSIECGGRVLNNAACTGAQLVTMVLAIGLFLLHPLCHLFNILTAIVVLRWPGLGKAIASNAHNIVAVQYGRGYDG